MADGAVDAGPGHHGRDDDDRADGAADAEMGHPGRDDDDRAGGGDDVGMPDAAGIAKQRNKTIENTSRERRRWNKNM